MSARTPNRVGNRKRIQDLISNKPSSKDNPSFETEIHAHWAKYICVLVSGYIEQAVKEIILEHASTKCDQRISRYIDHTWPKSKNMKCDSINEILAYFDDYWSDQFWEWVGQGSRKKEINEIISWRNRIAHGEVSSTNNVTLVSVTKKFHVACEVIDFLEQLTC